MALFQPENEEESYDHRLLAPPLWPSCPRTTTTWPNTSTRYVTTSSPTVPSSAKVKTLMTLVCDAITAHEDGCRNIGQPCPRIGAPPRKKSLRTVQVAFLFGGMPALVTACAAFKDD